ncbi:hypothetical protein [Actinokineospora sp.]|uniref:hypothetical protein n=1 Tax=Actinokineospora sp. TaxID=1872133 RepID=UPI00403764A9
MTSVPGSGGLGQHERVLTARVHTMVALDADTVMVKVLAPGALDWYLRGEVSAGVVGARPPFDFRLVGGTVARRQDCVHLRTPRDHLQAFRLDYAGSPFHPDLPELHTMEFPVLHPDHFVVPFGAPTALDLSASSPAVRDSAYAMTAAAREAGVDPNTYRTEIAPWPYTGTGLSAGGDLALPLWWRRPGIVPRGARIMAHPGSRPVAIYRPGWADLR